MEQTKVENTIAKTYCSGCGKFFSSPSAHAKHRTGDYIVKTSRRCLTDKDMRARGYDTEKKNVRIVVEGRAHHEEHDVWFDAVGREKVRAAFGKPSANEEE